MHELRKFVAPEFLFGRGAINLVSQFVDNLGSENPFIVTDAGLLKTKWPDMIFSQLKKEHIDYSVFSAVSPNPRSEEVMSGVKLFNESGCDSIIALGGGSVIDCAKGIVISSVNGENVLSFEGVDKVSSPGPPLICIPTTAGSSADVSQFAIINDRKIRVKRAIISKAVVPDVALIDPQTTHTMDNYLTACTAVDALVHAVEAYVSSAHSPLFDIHSIEAVKIIFKSLPKVLQNPDDVLLRDDIMRASLEAGLAFSNASLGAVHAMAHSLGGYIDLPHGICNSVLFEHVVEYNSAAAEIRYSELAEAAGCPAGKGSSEEFINLILSLKKEAGLTARLSDLGVKENDIPVLSEHAVKDICMITNPVQPDVDDITHIYKQAF